jgi:hypothetical protein
MGLLRIHLPAVVVVVLISVVVGLLMVVVFRYVSDQKAIGLAKDRLAAHLLAVRLFQDQIGVVLRSYGRIVLATGHYLRLAFKPVVVMIIPLTFLISQLDRSLGFLPIQPGHAFLVKAHVANSDALNDVVLHLPQGLTATADPVHAPSANEIVWRVVASANGDYQIAMEALGQTISKSVRVDSGLSRVSPMRLRGKFWERILFSGEPAIPGNAAVDAIEILYAPRFISLAGIEWNWIWLFFVISLAAGFLFKSILGIEI